MSRIEQIESGISLMEVETAASNIAGADVEQPSATTPCEAALPQKPFWADRRRVVIALILILAVYTSLALAMSAAKAPWIDEGWISIPSWNLAFHGKTGNPVMEPTGFWLGDNLAGIREIDYLNMPLYMPVQAAVFRIFGFSILSMRSLSMLFGGIALIIWFAILKNFARTGTALLATALMAFDFTYLTNATDGRMDMMCMCLWSLGIMLYLRLREGSLKRALLWANMFVSASLFTHPNGIIGFVLLGTFVATMDRKALRPADSIQCWPYAAGLAGWLAYIAIKPTYFLSQFGANSGSETSRLNLLPWNSIRDEVILRYLSYFSGNTPWGQPTPPYALFVMFLYWAAFLVVIVTAIKRQNQIARQVGHIAGVVVGALCFLVGFKAPNYLIHVIPVYAACMAVWITTLRRRKEVAVVFLGALIVFQVFIIRAHIRQGDTPDYEATISFVRNHVDPQARLVAGSHFFLDLRNYNLSDDMKLGYRTHIDPDFIITDRWYKLMWEGPFIEHPGIWLYVHGLMASNHVHRIFQRGQYAIYAVDPGFRNPPQLDGLR